MASHVVVIDFGMQQRKIVVTPSKTLSDIRNDACTRQRDDPSNYGLKHNGRALDLSLTFRQSGLSSGAKLELVVASKSPSVVSVALQHPDGTRQTDKVPSTTTLWLLLRKFESGASKNINITARGIAQMDSESSGRMFYEAPVLRVMNREYTEFEDLQKTLAQIGVNSGSVLISLRYRKTDQPLEAAMAEIGGYFQETLNDMSNSAASKVAADGETSITAPKSQPQSSTSALPSSDGALDPATRPLPPSPFSSEAPAQTQRQTSPTSIPTSTLIPASTQREVEVFAAPSSSTPHAAIATKDISDSAFEPSIADLKRLQSTLESKGKNRRLLSDAELAEQSAEKEARRSAVRETTVKIRFPDETSVVFKVGNEDSGKSVYEFVRGLVVDAKQPFWLVYRGAKRPNERLEDSEKVKLIKDAGFSGPTLINFVWGDNVPDEAKRRPALQEDYRQQAKPIPVPEAVKPESSERVSKAGSSQENKTKPEDKSSKEERLMKAMGMGKLFGKK